MAIENGPKNRYSAYGVPSLDITFADKKSLIDRISGNNLITFTRASAGTYVGSDGLIKTAAVNEPRFDHNPLTRESLGLLVEEARTNLLQRSGQIGTSPWGIRINAGNSATVEQNSLLAPDGTLSATKVTITRINNDFSGIYQDISSVTGNYTFSAWMRLGDGVSDKNLQFYSDNAIGNRINVTLTSAWQRLTVTFTGGTYTSIGVGNWYSSLPSNWIDSTPFYIWGAQLEAGAYPTSYIPTTTATVTRAADVASITGTNFSSWYNTNAGTTFFDARVKTPAGSFSHGFLSQESTGHFRCGINGNNWYAWTTNVGGISDLGSGGGVIDGRNRGIFSYDKSIPILAQSFNGNAVGSLAGRTPVSPTNVPLVYSPGSVQVSRLTYYPTRLPDTTLQALTKL